MNKYHNGEIYKIVDVGYNKCYIGSTTEKLSQRMTRHRSDYNRHNDGRRLNKISVFELFDEFGLDNCKIELVEYCKCETKDELVRREGELIKNSDCVNKQIAGRTKKEYAEENREALLKQKHEYGKREYTCDICNSTMRLDDKSKHLKTEKHKRNIKQIEDPTFDYKAEIEERRKEYRQRYYEFNKETINEKNKFYRDSHKEQKRIQDKLYRENNAEKIREMKRIWYETKKQQKLSYTKDN